MMSTRAPNSSCRIRIPLQRLFSQPVRLCDKMLMTKADKEKANKMLFVNGITFNSEMFLKFDVLVNDVDNGIETTAASSEFAGNFSQVPHKHSDKMLMTSGAAFGITELLEDMEAKGDEYVLVTLIPQAGTDDATVSEIKIQLVPIV